MSLSMLSETFVISGYTFKLGQQVGVNVGPTHQAGSRRGIKDFVSSFCDSFGSITHIEPWNDTQVLDKLKNGHPGCSIFMGRKNCTWGKEPSSWWWCSCNLCKQRLKLNHFVQIHTISKHTQHLQEMCNCYLLRQWSRYTQTHTYQINNIWLQFVQLLFKLL